MTIKAIETLYMGHYFRSKAEARFAVFLDCLGVKWEYEPQGFDLGNGLKYLPDFKIYDVSTCHNSDGGKISTYDYMWVEVKGMWDDNRTGKLLKPDFEKIMRFAFDDTFDDDCYGSEVKNPIWVVGNTFTLDPTNENYIHGDTGWGSDSLINNFMTIDGDSYGFIITCPKTGMLVLCGRDSNYIPDYICHEGCDLVCPNVLNALREANRYKFDHGGQFNKASCFIYENDYFDGFDVYRITNDHT